MKRIITLFMILWAFGSYAQIKDYTFLSTVGTYSEITGGTILGNEASDFQYFVDPDVPLGTFGTSVKTGGPGFPIGFNFTFNGVVYDRFGVFNGGWISLGSSAVSPNPVDLNVTTNTLPLNSTNASQPANLCATIAALANDLGAQSGASLRYLTIGTAPYRTLVVQWKGYKKRTNTTGGDSFDFQIRLNETTNVIQFAYGAFSNNATSMTLQVGLRGAPTSAVTNFACRKSSTDWSNSVAGTNPANDKMTLSSTVKPAMGLTYTWSPAICGVKDLVTSNITTTSADLNWGTYSPTPSSFQYIVSTSSTVPVDTSAATSTTTTTANLSGLTPNTLYYIYMQNVCDSQSTVWKQIGTFTTLCPDVNMLFENFDSYNLAYKTFPDCWGKVIVSGVTPPSVSVTLNGSSVAPASAPNRLSIGGNASASNLGISYIILPTMSNIGANTNRLKFKAYAENGQAGRTLDVGYYTNSNDVNTFQSIQTISLTVGAAAAVDYIYTPGALVGVKNLGFRNAGYNGTGSVVYVDDVIWEPTTTCPDVTALKLNSMSDVSANISWTPLTTTAWQYAIASPSVINPYTLQGTDVTGTNPTIQLNNLSPSTGYKVWVRSKCDTGLGAWVGPLAFTTACASVAEFAENFDLQTGSNPLPACWKKFGGTVTINQTSNPMAPSAPNSVKMDVSTIVGLPPLSTSQDGNHQLRIKIRGSVAGVKLDIGYLSDGSDVATFTAIDNVIATSTTAFTAQTKNLGQLPKTAYLALRTPASGQVYIDDVVWEAIPSCPGVANLTALAVTSNSATLQWTPGDNENLQWQYVLGGANDANPFVLPVSDLSNAADNGFGAFTSTIIGLTPNTNNKIWLRSKCIDGSWGAWVGPLSLITTCIPGTEFTQYFDATGVPAIPSCWAMSGSTGSVSVNAPTGGVTAPSTPNVLILQTTSTSGPSVAAMPAMSNTAAGTHRLTFKYRDTKDAENGVLEVGYLDSIGDPTSFHPLGSSFACTSVFQDGIAELGTEPGSQILAFRNNGSSTIQIDNVVWAHVPVCADISKLTVNTVSDTAIGFNWTKGDSETTWQYAIGPVTALTPVGLAIYDVIDTPATSATNLLPNTSYKIWVRSKCGSLPGNWGTPVTATTTCTPVANFSETFETNNIPACWTRMGTKGSVSLNTSLTEPKDGFKLIMYSSSATDASIMAMPPLSNPSSVDHILKFRFKGTLPGTKLEVGYITDILDPGSFSPIQSFEAPSDHVSSVFSVGLGNSPLSNVLAFRNLGENKASVLIDDVSWALPPATVPACATNVSAMPSTICGKYATVISWDPVADADGYLIDISTAPGSSYVLQDQDAGTALSYSFIGNANTTYYYTVKPYNNKGVATGCSLLSFVTIATDCYCVSAPMANDNFGISKVQIGASNFTNGDVTYHDFSAKPVNVGQGEMSNLKITFGTVTPYNVFVWVDFNNDYNFDASERVYDGMSAPSQVSVVDASFTVPATAALGMHRMRIATMPGTLGLGDPCNNSTYGVTLDFNVNVVVPVVNDKPAGAISLVVGSDFASKAITGTNVNATGSIVETDPGCGVYNGMDVWYKAVVPESGNLTFEINSVSGGITDTAAAAYFGSADSLTLAKCDDSSSTAGDNQPKMTFNNWSPGVELYFRVWENGGDAFGPFKVSAYDASLGVNDFDAVNFSYYPNPVKDVLNLSFNQEMSNVSVVNLLGQKVMSKSLNSNQGKIDMSGLSSGAYLVKVSIGNQSKTIKVVKE